ncbi:MAG: cyclic pyranopterin monophosphate synthase MoaC [Rhodovibrionaceae bacterium]
MNDFTHLDSEGKARMVDVTAKDASERVAVAKGEVAMAEETARLIREGGVAKGDVFSVARLAGIMGAKKTAELIPLCHPLMLTSVAVELELAAGRSAVEITATCKLSGKTGVEMEALTAVSVAALTIYDMCKAVDKAMYIEKIRLVKKTGGKSGTYEAE